MPHLEGFVKVTYYIKVTADNKTALKDCMADIRDYHRNGGFGTSSADWEWTTGYEDGVKQRPQLSVVKSRTVEDLENYDEEECEK